MTTTNDDRNAHTRAMLIGYVTAHPSRQGRGVWAIVLLLVGALAGAGVSTAAFAATWLVADAPAQPTGQPAAALSEPIPAPDGVTPGAPVIAALGDPVAVSFDGDFTYALTDRPDAATHLRVTIAPNLTEPGVAASQGFVSFGTDAGGNNPSMSWTADDIRSGTDVSSWYDLPLDSTTSTLFLHSEDAPATATLQYVTHVPTKLGINDKGDTYGMSGSEQGEPDLILVAATNGREGYAYRDDLEDADGTTAAHGFDSPEDAATWQEANAGRVHVIPVYEPDGVTQIGEFHIGG